MSHHINFQHDLSAQLRDSQCQNYSSIVRSLQDLVDTPEEVYWISKGLYSVLESSVSDALLDCLVKLLEEETSLLSHLQSCGGLRCGQYQEWFSRGFAGIFQTSILARLWDKLIGGSVKILAYVLAAALFRSVYNVKKFVTKFELNLTAYCYVSKN